MTIEIKGFIATNEEVVFKKDITFWTKVLYTLKFFDAVHWESDLALATMMKREFEEANDMKLTAWQWRKL